MTFPEKPLGFVKHGLEKMGRQVSHVYEDLIFPDHAAYLIQFGEESGELKLHFNADCPAGEEILLKDELVTVFAGEMGFSLDFCGKFSMEQAGDEEISLKFLTENR